MKLCWGKPDALRLPGCRRKRRAQGRDDGHAAVQGRAQAVVRAVETDVEPVETAGREHCPQRQNCQRRQETGNYNHWFHDCLPITVSYTSITSLDTTSQS